MEYPEQFRQTVIEKALTSGVPQEALAEEFGIGRSTLQKWLRDYRHSGAQSVTKSERRPQEWTPQERFAALVETAQMGEEELGKWCRRHGLHTHHLTQWKRDAMAGTEGHQRAQEQSETRRLREENKRLKKELRRKEKALAETSALLVLKKKAASIWGEPEDD